MLRSINEITNYQLKSQDGDIGRCKDFLFDDRQWTVRYMVADTNKWLPGGKKVLISPISLDEPDWQEKRFPVMLTRAGIENSPLLDEHKPVSKQYEIEFFNYYGYAYYWMGDGLWGPHTNPAPLIENEQLEGHLEQTTGDRHLRSTDEVTGYDINAIDESIGHIEDFILNDDNWSIAYIVVDTRKWLPGGRKVLISPSWFTSVSWVERTVSINLTAQQIKDSPEYNPKEFINPDYENVLHDFYNGSKKQ